MDATPYSPAVQTRHYRTLVFDPSLEIVLETEGDWKRTGEADIAKHGYVAGVDVDGLRQFLKEGRSSVEIKGVHINIASMEIWFRGYKLAEGRWMACSMSSTDVIIPITFPLEKVWGVVEYFYHMLTTA